MESDYSDDYSSKQHSQPPIHQNLTKKELNDLVKQIKEDFADDDDLQYLLKYEINEGNLGNILREANEAAPVKFLL